MKGWMISLRNFDDVIGARSAVVFHVNELYKSVYCDINLWKWENLNFRGKVTPLIK